MHPLNNIVIKIYHVLDIKKIGLSNEGFIKKGTTVYKEENKTLALTNSNCTIL